MYVCLLVNIFWKRKEFLDIKMNECFEEASNGIEAETEQCIIEPLPGLLQIVIVSNTRDMNTLAQAVVNAKTAGLYKGYQTQTPFNQLSTDRNSTINNNTSFKSGSTSTSFAFTSMFVKETVTGVPLGIGANFRCVDVTNDREIVETAYEDEKAGGAQFGRALVSAVPYGVRMNSTGTLVSLAGENYNNEKKLVSLKGLQAHPMTGLEYVGLCLLFRQQIDWKMYDQQKYDLVPLFEEGAKFKGDSFTDYIEFIERYNLPSGLKSSMIEREDSLCLNYRNLKWFIQQASPVSLVFTDGNHRFWIACKLFGGQKVDGTVPFPFNSLIQCKKLPNKCKLIRNFAVIDFAIINRALCFDAKVLDDLNEISSEQANAQGYYKRQDWIDLVSMLARNISKKYGAMLLDDNAYCKATGRTDKESFSNNVMKICKEVCNETVRCFFSLPIAYETFDCKNLQPNDKEAAIKFCLGWTEQTIRHGYAYGANYIKRVRIVL